MGLVALQHVGSSWPRHRTSVSCIGRRILIHCTTREVHLVKVYGVLMILESWLEEQALIFHASGFA